MLYSEMTNTARVMFIASILENEERAFMAAAMIQNFVNDTWTTDEIEEAING